VIKEFLAKLQKGKPIPPPAAPPPLNLAPAPFELPIPYALEEFPRTFLHFIKDDKGTPPQLKAMITTWLEDFDTRLVQYMHQRYGEGVSQVMMMITEGVRTQQAMTAEARDKATETDVLADLEKSLREETGEGSSSSA
jgi:hypothetical protein